MHAPALPPPIDPDLLMLAYRSGIFPMADTRGDHEVFWVEPRRRAILPLDGFHCSHSLTRVLRRGTFEVTCNAAFPAVIEACAGPRRDGGDTWISDRIERSYVTLHEEGHAHSIECWRAGDVGGKLVGGLYGVGFDRVFCGESMFSRMPDASKVALAWLVAALRRAGCVLLDCQFMTPHLATMGALEIDEADYLERLRAAQVSSSGPGGGEGAADGAALGLAAGAEPGLPLALPAGFAALLDDAAGLSSSPGNFIAQSFTQTS
ncbi:leucyl/phenylalanyl-tRNA--protein transferase [Novosphingobium sp.]|uniref:leucyl/phenylalanyl-tRNA--protein transferase n=1 Tax=Novosphingobium sp. TaxID=1874826 RepID=UPI0025E0760B|nr:leucyl/phenylalanyl-tRNA--protein transferase [Novosphingobium sp.]